MAPFAIFPADSNNIVVNPNWPQLSSQPSFVSQLHWLSHQPEALWGYLGRDDNNGATMGRLCTIAVGTLNDSKK
ncbi:hypothetical protein [Ferrimonas pelagia]|uniref:Uncharacterized protein n=1 Tax=Ferrimonas pelagia TaxID=1177826 RepID=A0ABP9EQ44_9GAMM